MSQTAKRATVMIPSTNATGRMNRSGKSFQTAVAYVRQEDDTRREQPRDQEVPPCLGEGDAIAEVH
jgi:hypothetical protein